MTDNSADVEWREAVIDALDGTGLDIDLVTDAETAEQPGSVAAAFAAALDAHDLGDADPNDPAFIVAIRAVAKDFADQNPDAREDQP